MAAGFILLGEIAISPVARCPLKTAVHELAHVLLYQADDLIPDAADPRAGSRR